MLEVIFLIVLGLVWVVFASVQDLKEQEVANWISFSLIIFALGFRFFWSLFGTESFMFFYQGLIGFIIFLVLGNVFYYSRVFAGGDAKLMIALGAVLGFSESFFINLNIYLVFLILFLFSGAFYGMIWSGVLAFKNIKDFKKEFYKKMIENKKWIFLIMFFGLVLMVFGFILEILFFLGIIIFIFPYLYIYSKAVDESCMIKKIDVKKLREGDWLYEDVKVGKKLIKAEWGGLSEEDIQKIQKNLKIIKVKQGIPFVPVFLMSFLGLIFWVFWKGLIV